MMALEGALDPMSGMSLGEASSSEMHLQLRIHFVTWNTGTAPPPDDISTLLQLDSQGPETDMYIIGLQEVNSKVLTMISNMIVEDSWSSFLMETLSPLGFIKLTSIRMQGLLLLVFVKYCHIPFIRDIQTSYTRTGLFGYWGNKGGVAIRFFIYGNLLCLMNCHLPAHMENANQRLDDFERMLEDQRFEGEVAPNIQDHDLVFWFGDLNFRIADHGLRFVRETINNKQFHLLWEKDQLNMAKTKEPFLKSFQEGALKFKPTYKFDLNSDTYDTSSKKRKPAWTDRILWKQKGIFEHVQEGRVGFEMESPIRVTLVSYTSHMCYSISDHKPVTGTFNLEMRKLVSIPLVFICPEGTWSSDQDAVISYSTDKEFPSSTWDWIGLYKVGFRSHRDYVTYIWVKDDEISSSGDFIQVYIGADEIPASGGEFLLCYFSSNLQSLVGISQSFQICSSHVGSHERSTPENINGLDPPNSLGLHF
ncbi:inositol polyphosphate 5-phosphatase K isoform X2 [Latimeria chalumnae]|uniref:Inositol polyphosphate-5-phosphatase K n=1 Tax=Latimeria chalumnae TaxID=7897 RepID=H3AEJ4_LATCH|nr:PREDICTED: inositol polyphosphate 5-phosphatase K isoform X1 [Latimeria chalumnae]|eukprot:XP_006006791.1 PREDICTED: inositol polyphosphate 5-phosphatase K isoform X1 [Latimeria chalumnae]